MPEDLVIETAQSLDAGTLSARLEEFFRARFLRQVEEIASVFPEKRRVSIPFPELERFDVELADAVLENPDLVLKSAEDALSRIDLPGVSKEKVSLKVAVSDLPSDKTILVRDIAVDHLGKLVCIDGVVRQATDILPRIKVGVYLCRHCGRTYRIEQEEDDLMEPAGCECGRKNFKLLEGDSVFVGYQNIAIQEPLEVLRNAEEAKALHVVVEADLTGKVVPGARLKFTGILRLQKPKRGRGPTTVYNRVLEAVHVQELQREYLEIEILPEEEEKIRTLSKDPNVYELLRKSVSPSIYGHEMVKEAIALQMFGGVKKELRDGTKKRGDMHLLLVGDPGTGKSQILKYAHQLSPKSIYIAGKMSTGAGIAATAEKDEISGGWTLKAGALVLASGGLAAIDELDKMDADDQSAMHEAAEQQSYHKDFEILLADGSTRKIGELVDGLMEADKEKVVQGKDCEILPTNSLELISTDFSKAFTLKADRVSRHKAPGHFVELTYSNGRKVRVTPEHPVFVWTEEGINEVPAENVKTGTHAPGVKNYPCTKKGVALNAGVGGFRKKLDFPAQAGNDLGRFLGYVASEGHSYSSQAHRYSEIGASNTDPEIVRDMTNCMSNAFNTSVNQNVSLAAHAARRDHNLTTVRLTSNGVYSFFQKNYPELLAKARVKRAPNNLKAERQEVVTEFLKTAFLGDGFVDGERFGYCTSSPGLACDYQDLLLQLGIYSYIASEKEKRKNRGDKYKVVVSGTGNMEKFREKVVEEFDKRIHAVKKLTQRSSKRESSRELLPHWVASELNTVLKQLRISNGYFLQAIDEKQNVESATVKHYLEKALARLENGARKLENSGPREKRKALVLSLNEVAQAMDVSASMVTYIERQGAGKNWVVLDEKTKTLALKKYHDLKERLLKLEKLLNSSLKLLTITRVERIKNTDSEWVYDVTVEPNHTFVSSGVVLHNTISVAKAGIVAQFKAETSILAAANPKFGRFDPNESIPTQLTFGPTLLSRFDLYYIIRDEKDVQKDLDTAEHILKAHRVGSMRLQKGLKHDATDKEVEREEEALTPPIEKELFRKYVALARQTCFPMLSREAEEEIKNFYRDLRKAGREDNRVTLTPRQLDALVRLAEASARVRLSSTATIEDARRAIRLLKTALAEVGLDPSTGQIDVDIIMTGRAHSEVERAKTILKIVEELSSESENVPVDKVVDEAVSKLNVSKDKALSIIDKLKREGELFNPRHGILRLTSQGG